MLAITLCGVLYYRKKYHKEKDPELPTVTYQPEPKTMSPAPVEAHREFQNPLFTKAPQLSEEEKQLEKLKVGTKQSYFTNTSTRSSKLIFFIKLYLQNVIQRLFFDFSEKSNCLLFFLLETKIVPWKCQPISGICGSL